MKELVSLNVVYFILESLVKLPALLTLVSFLLWRLLGQDSSVTVTGPYSCTDNNACSGITTTAIVGDSACTGVASCRGASALINSLSCQFTSSCENAAGIIGTPYDPVTGIIPMGACVGDYTCKGLQPSANISDRSCVSNHMAVIDGEGACKFECCLFYS